MGNKIVMYFVLLSSFYAFGNAEASAQQYESNSFLRSLSFEWFGGSVYNGYTGYSTSARLGIAVVKAPTLNRIFWQSPEASEDLLLLAGVKSGTINAHEALLNSEVQLLAPEVSIHYPLLKMYKFGIYGGPSLEITYTNNSRQYIAVPSFGIDLGFAYHFTQNFGIAIENRWILSSKSDPVVNNANFPGERYAYIGVGIHFSLPWQSEESAFEEAQIEYDKKSASFEETRWELMERIHEIDSLNFENSELKKDMESMTVRVRVDTVKVLEDIEAYDPAKRTESPEYLFTKDPFKGGSLVNDGYLKNVLIDILDDEYVWQISAKSSRRADAVKIRNFFAAYNGATGRRIAITNDESVSIFKLTCLGKVKSAVTGTKKR